MQTNIGLWIDHRKAVIVLSSNGKEQISEIPSHADRQPGREDGVRVIAAHESQQTHPDDVLDRKFAHQLNAFYDAVIDAVHHARVLLIMGPGEAKGELAKRLEHMRPNGRAVHLEAKDKLTNRQIAACVRERFETETPVIMSH